MQNRKTFNLRLLMLFLALTCGMVLLVSCNESNFIDIKTYQIAPGNQATIPIILDKDVRVDVRMDTIIENADDSAASITREPENIGITIDDPSGNHVVDYMRIRAGDFMILPEENGEYVIILDNSHALSTVKNVTLKIKYS